MFTLLSGIPSGCRDFCFGVYVCVVYLIVCTDGYSLFYLVESIERQGKHRSMNVCSIFNSKSISTTTTTKYGSTKQCLSSLWFLLCSDLAIVLISSFAQAAKNSLPFAKKTKKKNGDDLMWKKNRRSSDAICMRVNEKKDSVQRINDAIEEFRQLETVKYQMLNLSPKRRIKMVRHNFFVSFFFFYI